MKNSFTAVLMLDNVQLAQKEIWSNAELLALQADAPIGMKWMLAY